MLLRQAHTCANLLELPDYWGALLARAGITDPASLSPDASSTVYSELKQARGGY